jgi:hypothetical protein
MDSISVQKLGPYLNAKKDDDPMKVDSVAGWAAQTTESSTTFRRYDRDTQTSQTLQSSS